MWLAPPILHQRHQAGVQSSPLQQVRAMTSEQRRRRHSRHQAPLGGTPTGHVLMTVGKHALDGFLVGGLAAHGTESTDLSPTVFKHFSSKVHSTIQKMHNGRYATAVKR